VAKKQDKLELFRARLTVLAQSIPEELRLESMKNGRMEGFAACFVVVLPLLNAQGESVFTSALLMELFRLLNQRFGGCMVPSASSHPPYWGLWHPMADPSAETEKDYVTTIQIFANPIEATSRFFSGLKQILKTAGNIVQEEILIARFDCWLI
jgi:hypothetical protein